MRAIGNVNVVLSALPDTTVRLRPGWQNDEDRVTDSTIPVYAVSDEGLGRFEVAFVVEGCAAVIIQGPAFDAWLGAIQDSDSLTADRDATLAFLLLHETGHLTNHDCEGAGALGGGMVYTKDASGTKRREIDADSFAARALRASSQQWRDGLNAALSIEMAVSTLSFLVSGNRITTHLGASLLPTREVFWDFGFSHPNLEWRLLSVNYQLDPTPVARRLLDDFEAHRDEANGVILDLRRPASR